MLRHVMTGARREERPLIREMPVDGGAADTGPLRNGADRCLGRAELLVQGDGSFDNALPGFILAFGAFLEFVSSHPFHGHYCNAILTTPQTGCRVPQFRVTMVYANRKRSKEHRMNPVNVNDLELQEVASATDPTVVTRFTFPVYAATGATGTAVVYFEVEPGKRLASHHDGAEEVLYIVQGQASPPLGINQSRCAGPAIWRSSLPGSHMGSRTPAM